jgi:AraC-like DNA-binding protein
MKLVDRLDLARQKRERDMRTQAYLESIRSQYILELILGNHPGYGWEEECVNVGLGWLLKGNLRLVLVSMDQAGLRSDLETFKTSQFAVQNVMYEIIAGCTAICPVRLSVGRWLLAVGEGADEQWLHNFCAMLHDSIARYTKQNVHIMISEPGEHVLDMSRLFWETEKMMEYMGQDPAQPIRSIHPSQKELAYGQWSKPMQQLIGWIAEGETDAIVGWLNELGASFPSWDLESAQRWCFEWLFTLQEHLQPGGESGGAARPDADALRMKIAGQVRNRDLLQFFRQEIHRMIKKRHGKRPHKLIKKAIEIIERNYDQNIQLATIAEELGMSPVYLSEFFKLQTGVTFRSYLLQVRMAEAIRLLKDPTIKVYEVSYRVGYAKVEHFVKLFKKHYGMTPSEYRGALV